MFMVLCAQQELKTPLILASEGFDLEERAEIVSVLVAGKANVEAADMVMPK